MAAMSPGSPSRPSGGRSTEACRTARGDLLGHWRPGKAGGDDVEAEVATHVGGRRETETETGYRTLGGGHRLVVGEADAGGGGEQDHRAAIRFAVAFTVPKAVFRFRANVSESSSSGVMCAGFSMSEPTQLAAPSIRPNSSRRPSKSRSTLVVFVASKETG